jgi:hypothetical protein
VYASSIRTLESGWYSLLKGESLPPRLFPLPPAVEVYLQMSGRLSVRTPPDLTNVREVLQFSHQQGADEKEQGEKTMTKGAWTPRAYRIRNAVAAVVFLLAWYQMYRLAFPEECRGVSVHETSELCQKMLVEAS